MNDNHLVLWYVYCIVEELCQTTYDSISSRFSHLYNNIWWSTCLARFYFAFWHPPYVHPHISFATSRSTILTYAQTLSFSAGICWHFIYATCSTFFCTAVFCNFQVFLLGQIWIGLTSFAYTTKSQTSNLSCIMHSLLISTFVSLMFFSCALLTRIRSIYVWLPPDKKVISLLLFLQNKVSLIASLLATQK